MIERSKYPLFGIVFLAAIFLISVAIIFQICSLFGDTPLNIRPVFSILAMSAIFLVFGDFLYKRARKREALELEARYHEMQKITATGHRRADPNIAKGGAA